MWLFGVTTHSQYVQYSFVRIYLPNRTFHPLKPLSRRTGADCVPLTSLYVTECGKGALDALVRFAWFEFHVANRKIVVGRVCENYLAKNNCTVNINRIVFAGKEVLDKKVAH